MTETKESNTIVTRWWWIRHAPVPNPEQRCYGQRDMDCDTSHEPSFHALAARLPKEAVWIATTLQRTQLTAAAIHAAAASADKPQMALERDLMEQHFGQWQGLTYAEIGAFGLSSAAMPNHRFWLAPAHEVPPGGESFVDVIARVSAAVTRLNRMHAGRDIVAVAHGGSIRAALAFALDLNPEAALAFSIDPLSLTRVDHVDGPGAGHGWRIGVVNQPAV
ncbi:MAG TPA: histidine phosphatase family protein [Alphaproteobacteria bacterium]